MALNNITLWKFTRAGIKHLNQHLVELQDLCCGKHFTSTGHSVDLDEKNKIMDIKGRNTSVSSGRVISSKTLTKHGERPLIVESSDVIKVIGGQ